MLVDEENDSIGFECDVDMSPLTRYNINYDDDGESMISTGKRKCTTRRVVCHALMMLLAMALIFTGLLFLPWFVECMYRYGIHRTVVLDPDSPMYSEWAHPSLPMYQSFYLMDLQNPHDVIKGEKPKVKERGPYVYRFVIDRDNITFNDNDTVSFLLRQRYFFDEERSVGPESDTVTALNTPLVTTAYKMQDSRFLMRTAVNGLLNVLHEDLTMKKTIREVLWGYQEPLFHVTHELGASLPGLESEKFGYYMGFNDTHSGSFTVYTGRANHSLLNHIDKVDDQEILPFWWSDQANQIRDSSDGSMFHPYVQTDETLLMYQPQICRSISFKFVNKTRFKGIPLLKFSLSPSTYMNPTSFPPNEGFCRGQPELCGPSGVMRLDPCRYGTPIAISNPHFYGGDDSLLDGVDGLSPNATLHENYMEIEPNTGIPFVVKFRLQINMYMKPVHGMRDTGQIRETYLPLLWVEQSVEANDPMAAKFRLSFVDAWYIVIAVQWLLFGLGVLVLLWLLAKTAKIVVDSAVEKERKESLNRNEITATCHDARVTS